MLGEGSWTSDDIETADQDGRWISFSARPATARLHACSGKGTYLNTKDDDKARKRILPANWPAIDHATLNSTP